MGVDKLLLPWRGNTLIDSVIDAWLAGDVDAVVAVANPNNEPLIAHLQDRDIDVVVPDTCPLEMKHSVQHALAAIAQTYAPHDDDLWLLAPADVPLLSPEVIRQVVKRSQQTSRDIIVPVCGKLRGHPAAFRWRLADEVARLSETEGVNALLGRHEVELVECGPAAMAKDVDTPQEYRRLLDGQG